MNIINSTQQRVKIIAIFLLRGLARLKKTKELIGKIRNYKSATIHPQTVTHSNFSTPQHPSNHCP